jgi:hypothetical protein
MWKKFVYLSGLACGLGILITLLVQSFRVEGKLAHIARPSRLFNPSMIISHSSPKKEWDVKLSKSHDQLVSIVCQQRLQWLGRGMQAVVFETQDQKYVVKFFQLGRLREDQPRGLVKTLLSGESKEKRQERLTHRQEIFSSSKMCFEELQEETGIVYVHLNRTKNKVRWVKLVDKNGQSHRVRGDETSFVIQRKARLLVPTMMAHMEAGDVARAKARIDQVFDLLLSLAKKGFADCDDALIRNNNIGLTEDRAIYIDTGHLFHAQNLDVSERMRYEFQVRLDPFERWLNVMYPDLGAYYRSRREEIMAALVREQISKGPSAAA